MSPAGKGLHTLTTPTSTNPWMGCGWVGSPWNSSKFLVVLLVSCVYSWIILNITVYRIFSGCEPLILTPVVRRVTFTICEAQVPMEQQSICTARLAQVCQCKVSCTSASRGSWVRWLEIDVCTCMYVYIWSMTYPSIRYSHVYIKLLCQCPFY